MKNTIKVLGIIAIAAIIGFSMVSCGDDGQGTPNKLTITGLESYNGKYAFAIGQKENIYAVDSINYKKGEITAVEIKNGSVTLKCYAVLSSGEVHPDDTTFNTVADIKRTYDVIITSTKKITDPEEGMVGGGTVSVTFPAGIGEATGEFVSAIY